MDTSVGPKAVIWGAIGTELLAVVYDLRYMILCSVILIVTDLWWGYRESKKRLAEAIEVSKAVLIDKYRWHKSRAVRRTTNKFVDYMTYLMCGALIGLAITEPTELCTHIITAACGLGIGCACEIASILGHILYVKLGVEVGIMDAWRWFVMFLGKLFSLKAKEIGKSIESLADINDKQ